LNVVEIVFAGMGHVNVCPASRVQNAQKIVQIIAQEEAAAPLMVFVIANPVLEV
jgi:hypothetical protein